MESAPPYRNLGRVRSMIGRPRSVSDDAIFDALSQVITEHGPAALTLARVAAGVGLTASALMQRFGSKRGLLVAFAAREAGGVQAVFDDARQHAPRPVDAIPRALRELASPIASREGLANNIALLALDLTDPELGVHAVAQSRMVRACLATLVREAADRGDLVEDPPDHLGDSLYATYNGALVTWAIDGSGALGDWVASHVEQVLDPYRA